MAVNSLFAEAKIVHNFSHMQDLFFNLPLLRGDGPVSELPAGPQAVLPAEAEQWIVDRSVTGLMMLKDGVLVQDRL